MRFEVETLFRNILVHDYLSVDPAKVHERLQHGLVDLEAFINYIYDFLIREGYLDSVNPISGE